MKKKTPKIILLAMLISFGLSTMAQVAINTDGSSTDASAMLEVKSADKGLLIPNVTLTGTTDASTISTPAVSLLVYNTATVSDVTPGYYYNAGTTGSPVWTRFSSLAGTSTGQMQYWNGTAWVVVAATTNEGATLQMIDGIPTWTGGILLISVTNPTTGETWMDRNLGATQVATSSTDAASYGDLYQWGRGTDGHQIRTSATTTTLSSTDVPHGNFILTTGSPNDWRSPQNDNLWQGVGGTNNPCPTGYRIPTGPELEAERVSWSSNNPAGAFASPLKLPVAGYRYYGSGSLTDVGTYGLYWSSTINGTSSRSLFFYSGSTGVSSDSRATGMSIRCIKQATVPGAPTIGTATAGDTEASVAYTQPASNGGSTITSYTATSSPGNITGTLTQAGSGTIIVTGLTNGTAYTFTVTATNAIGTSVASAASNSVTPATIPNVTNPFTGKTWMDRNLGATQVATSSTDAASYGDLYQWGRGTDGHQIRTSATTTSLSSTDLPGHGNFILTTGSPNDWRSPQNDNLWQGVSGINNPCPAGYRIPTDTELDAERGLWSSNDAAGAFASLLKLPVAGVRSYSSGSLTNVGNNGYYWSSTINGTSSRSLYFHSGGAFMDSYIRAPGFSVRCIKD